MFSAGIELDTSTQRGHSSTKLSGTKMFSKIKRWEIEPATFCSRSGCSSIIKVVHVYVQVPSMVFRRILKLIVFHVNQKSDEQ